MRAALFKTLVASLALSAAFTATAQQRTYGLEYRLDLTPAPDYAAVSVTVVQSAGELRRVRFSAISARFTEFDSPDGLVRDGDQFLWTVPRKGGKLSWRAPVTHVRDDGELDAKLGMRWGLFRGEDVFPAMASASLKGAQSVATLQVDLPKSWSFVSPFPEQDQGYRIDNPARRFDRPTGWMVAGDLGVRIDAVAGVRVSVTAPTGQNVRRQDMLALINWTLPDLIRVLPDYPRELLVVSAGDPFWRGGLSGPRSLYVHARRPLISENGTSTLVHELFHVGLGRRAARGDDWIVEGLAEYYSVELLRRSGTVTARRHKKTMRSLARWSEEAGSLQAASSNGAVTARAVGVFAALDADIRTRTDGEKSLDDVVRRLVGGKGRLGLAELQEAVAREAGAESKVVLRIDGND